MSGSTSLNSKQAGLGLFRGEVRLVKYCDEWPKIYDAEKNRIVSALTPCEFAIEHVGSTSVPGLEAKPIIDIMLGIPDISDIENLAPESQFDTDTDSPSRSVAQRLLNLDYIFHGERGVPGRIFFTYGEPRIIHLHLVKLNEYLWRRKLLFRHLLSTDSRIAQEYMELKRQLAAEFPSHRDAYTSGKVRFIENALDMGGLVK